MLVAALQLSACVSSSIDDADFTSTNALQSSSNGENALDNSANQPVILDSDIQTQTIKKLPGETEVEDFANIADSDRSFIDPVSQEGRQRGIEEIRAKAAKSGNSPPDIQPVETTHEQHLSTYEQELIKAELKAQAQASQGIISDEELAAKQAQIAQLRETARRHYKQTLKHIEN